jgi:DNA-binding beta-propeller fold protein YncE
MSFGENFSGYDCGHNRVAVKVGEPDPQTLKEVLDWYSLKLATMQQRTLFVAAAGNECGSASQAAPAALTSESLLVLRNMLTVGATDNDAKAYFSNAGPAVSIAAPGVKVLGEQPDSVRCPNNLKLENGTSQAAPLVSGAAGILQAISSVRGGKLKPKEVKQILLRSGARIATSGWDNLDVRRLDVLAAVCSVLGCEVPTNVYVADRDQGEVLAFGVSGGGQLATGDVVRKKRDLPTPVGLVASPVGWDLYAVQSGGGGAGIAELDAQSLQPHGSLIPLPPLETNRPKIVLSKDGRLLYVSTGDGIAIADTDDDRLVTRFQDLPEAYNWQASQGPLTPTLADRLQQLRTWLVDNRRVIADMELSSDGKTLFVATSTEIQGQSPAKVLFVDVDLYEDAALDAPDLQSDLRNYFTMRSDNLSDEGAFSPRGGPDEPSDLAVSPDGNQIYLVHNGYLLTPITADTSQLTGLILDAEFTLGYGSALAGSIAGSGGLGAISEIVSANLFLSADIAAELIKIIQGGELLVSSPGTISKFDSNVPAGQATDSFPSALVLGSTRPPLHYFDPVIKKRPMAMAIRPDGKRALVPYWFTGNFGVLDTDKQELDALRRNPDPQTDGFKGYVGVTQSIDLDNTLWPNDPADVALLFPWDIKYAQNGKFAVAVHAGSSGHSVCSADPNNPACAQHGAISIIDDTAIQKALDAHAGESVQFSPTSGATYTSSYFSVHPICESLNGAAARARCAQDVVTPIRQFSVDGSQSRFISPRAVAIGPFLRIETPRFGDHVTYADSVEFSWSDPKVSYYTLSVSEVGGDLVNIVPDQVIGVDARRASETIAAIFEPDITGKFPVNAVEYEIEVAVCFGTPCLLHPEDVADRERWLATASVRVRYEDAQ